MGERMVTVAKPGTPCGWTTYDETGAELTCQGGREAVHILTATLPVAPEGTALCGFHSPYDVTEADRATINAEHSRMVAEAAKPRAKSAKPRAVREAQSGMDVLKELLTLEPVKASVRHEVGPTGKTHCGRTLATNGTGRACKSCAKVKRVETGQTYGDVRAAREAEVVKATEPSRSAVKEDKWIKGNMIPGTPIDVTGFGWSAKMIDELIGLGALVTDGNGGHVAGGVVKVASNVCRSTNHVYCVGPCPQRDRNQANASATRTHVETEQECVARIAREDFRVGDVVTFRTTTGYRLSQNRPYDCRYVCRCGVCDGVTTVTEQRLTEVIHWVSGGLDIRGAEGGYRMVRPDRLD